MDQKDVALRALEKAIRIEKDGHRFYLQAAERTTDQRGKEVFLTLADAEEDHLRIVEKQYDSLSKGKGWLALAETRGKVDLEKPLFPPGREALEKMVRHVRATSTPCSWTWALRTRVTNSTGRARRNRRPPGKGDL